MSYHINITRKALKQYEKISNPLKNIIKSRIDELSQKGLELSNIKALSGELKGMFRLKINDYRVIFDIENNIITIISILHRKDSYK